MAEIGLAGPEQLADFVELLEEAAEWLWSRDVRQWQPGSNREQLPLLRRQLARGALVVARREGALHGGCLVTREPTPEWAGRPGDAAYLHKLVVARAAAGQGLGDRILRRATGLTRELGLARLRLDCWDGNAVLRRYYRERGFRELEAVPSFGYSVRLFEGALDPPSL